MDEFQVFDSLLNPVAVCSETGEIVFINEQWKKYGEKRGSVGDVVGDNYLDHCVGSDSSDIIRDHLEELLSGERESFVLEYPCHGPLESDWFEVYGSVLKADGERFIVLEHVNISERRVLENEISRLESFLTSHTKYMNHEIRNKLSIISGHTDLTKEKIAGSFPRVIDSHILPVMNAVDEVTSLLENHTPTSPIFESPSPREVDIDHVINQVVSQMQYDDVSFTVDVSGLFLADEVQLKHLVENIILNSIEHSGGESTEISIRNLEPDSVNGFYIEDSGSGFPESGSVVDLSKGELGVGLTIVKKVAKNHGWDVEFENTESGGRVVVSGLESLPEGE